MYGVKQQLKKLCFNNEFIVKGGFKVDELRLFRATYALDRDTIITTEMLAVSIQDALKLLSKNLKVNGLSLDDLIAVSILDVTEARSGEEKENEH